MKAPSLSLSSPYSILQTLISRVLVCTLHWHSYFFYVLAARVYSLYTEEHPKYFLSRERS